jgi:imidazolonepropionase-like amidohydrolase
MTTSKAHARQAAAGPARPQFGDRYVIAADRVFDGTRVLEGHAVVVSQDKITAVVPAERLPGPREPIRFAGTLLPGFIELHAHLRLGQVPPDVVLRHGLTTVRETGGPLVPPSGGDGRLRLLAAGPILTAPHGYPVPVFGPAPALEVADIPAAREAVGRLVDGGAALIKIALEPGGSPGAPWTSGHQPAHPPPWPVMPLEVARAIVGEAHARGLIVSVHLSGPEGAALALDAGADEWAHVPCDPIPRELAARAAAAGVRVLSTLDTLSHCPGVAGNAIQLGEAGVQLLYGTDLAHPDVPWGINAHELMLMANTAFRTRTPLEVLSAATAQAGEHLGLAPLGQLIEGAPADLIGVRGNPLEQFKPLEYPDLVISGGVPVTGGATCATSY